MPSTNSPFILFGIFALTLLAGIGCESAPLSDTTNMSPYKYVAQTGSETTDAEHDPWEKTNRAVFGFNLSVKDNVTIPLARGWASITNENVRNSVSNFFNNTHYPFHLLNNLGQGKIKAAGIETGRFLMNTTVGFGGFLDPASAIGLEPHVEDFGQTMGTWGIGSGPYVMLPFFGPSSVRDSVGTVIWESWHVIHEGFFFALEVVNNEARYLEDFEGIRKSMGEAGSSGVDFYVRVRDSYTHYRQSDLADEGHGTHSHGMMSIGLE